MRSLSLVKKIAMILGPLLMLIIKFMPSIEGLQETGQSALAVLVFCIVWWVFSPVALPVTSLLGLSLLPLLGAVSIEEAFALFGNQAVFFVMGVFLVASIMLQTGLSARLALVGLRRVSDSEEKLCNGVLFFLGYYAPFSFHMQLRFLLPMILGLLRELNLSHNSRFAKRILLSMAWGTVCGSNLGLLSSARASLSLELFENYREGMQQNIPESIGILDFSLAAFPIILFRDPVWHCFAQTLSSRRGGFTKSHSLIGCTDSTERRLVKARETYNDLGFTYDWNDDGSWSQMAWDYRTVVLWSLFCLR